MPHLFDPTGQTKLMSKKDSAVVFIVRSQTVNRATIAETNFLPK